MQTDHASTFALDSLELGLLDEEAARAVRAHAETCPRCGNALAELRAARARFEAQVFARTLPAIEQRRSAASRFLRPLVLVPSLAALGAIGLAIGLRAPAQDEVTVKGSPFFEVYAHRSDRVFPVHDGTALAPGDEIRFVVQPAGLRHVMVASVDSAGVAAVYAPFGGRRSAKLPSATARFDLPGSVRLDQTAGPERLVALFSRQPLESSAVLAELRRRLGSGPNALRQAGDVCVPGAVCASVSIEKVVP